MLRIRGIDIDTDLDESLGGSNDATVLDAARTEGRLLITLDRGFGEVRAYPPGSHAGIIVLRPDDQCERTTEPGVGHGYVREAMALRTNCSARVGWPPRCTWT